MAKSIGFVAELHGDAQVRGIDGIIRVLNLGDPIKEGDVLTTGIGTLISLEFFDGNALQLGENIEMLLDESVFASLQSFADARVDQLDDLFALGDAAIDNQTPEADDSDSEIEDLDAGAGDLHQTSLYSREGREGIVDTRAMPIGEDKGGADDRRVLADDDVFGSSRNNTTNTSTSSQSTDPVASIAVEKITSDDVVNAAEASSTINLTGSVDGVAGIGDVVSFTANGNLYSGIVTAANTFDIAVAGVDLAAAQGLVVTVTGTTSNGTAYSSSVKLAHGVDTVANASVTVDPITADDLLNAAESSAFVNVSGSVGGDASAGDPVSFTLNGNLYSGTVAAGNVFSIPVNGTDLAADMDFDVTVSGSDAVGNPFTATSTSTHAVDTVASASITVDPITPDDTVNIAESGSVINLGGTVGGDAAPGDAITIIANGTTYTGLVGAGNTYSIPVAGSDLAVDTSFDLTVTGSDAAGNPFSATVTSNHSVDTLSSATISVEPITADNVLNAAEAGASITVSGSVGGDASPGDAISFTLNGNLYTGTVNAGNVFGVVVTGADLAADNSFDVSVSGNDVAGNPFTATTNSTHSINTVANASISIDPITADNIINALESGTPLTISGNAGGDAAPGDPISFTINGNTYSTIVAIGNSFSVLVPGADLAADSSVTANVSGMDAAGNPFSANTTQPYSVDTTASASIFIDNITADDVINASESGAVVAITGSVGGDAAPGDNISLSVNGNTYSGVVGAGNSFSIDVPGFDLAGDTSLEANVTGSDAAGNPFSTTTTSSHTVDTTASATIAVDRITADAVINAVEAGASINVSGTVGGDATIGDSISFSVNGTAYSGTVGAGNSFSVAVDGADLAGDTSFDVTVSGSDLAENPFNATTTSTHSVDLSASASISVDPITVDNVINAVESGAIINVSGSAGGDAVPGDTVSISVNGNTYSGTLSTGNTFSIAVPGSDLAADTSLQASVSGDDSAGNPYSATTTSSHSVDTGASAGIAVGPISADDVINAVEAAATITVIGSVSGDAAPGDSVNLVVNGIIYSGTVGAGNSFSIDVAGADLAADTTVVASVTGNDVAGNPFTATVTSTHDVDLTASATISVDNVTSDDIVNASEAGSSIDITGIVGGDAAPGDDLTIVVNGNTYAGTIDAGNSFTIAVPGSDLAADTSLDATVVGSDTAGNPFSATVTSTHSVDMATTATISVDDITADDIVNAAEAAGAINITGTVGSDAMPGDNVSINVNGNAYTGTVAAGNMFSIAVAGSDLAADTTVTATVTGSDASGNMFTTTTTSTHSVDLIAGASISVDNITADDIINAAELMQPNRVLPSPSLV